RVRRGADAAAVAEGVSGGRGAARAVPAAGVARAHEPDRGSRRHPVDAGRRGARGAARSRARRHPPPRRGAARALSGRDRWRGGDRVGLPAVRPGAPRGVSHRSPGLRAGHREEPGPGRGHGAAPRPHPGAEPGARFRGATARRARALMRTWKAVVLLNLALLVGAGWGYAFWGLRAARLERELVAAAAAGAGGGGGGGRGGGGGA